MLTDREMEGRGVRCLTLESTTVGRGKNRLHNMDLQCNMRLTSSALQMVDSSLCNVGNLNAAGNIVLSETAQRAALNRIKPVYPTAAEPIGDLATMPTPIAQRSRISTAPKLIEPIYVSPRKHVTINTANNDYSDHYDRNGSNETGRPPHRTQTLSPSQYQVASNGIPTSGRFYQGLPRSATSSGGVSPVGSSGLGSDGTMPLAPVYITKRFDSKSVQNPWWVENDGGDLLVKKTTQLISV
jgi:hypothetical protein